MLGFPFTTLLGATLMVAVLVTTAFTAAFRWTLAFGLPFIALAVCCLLVPLRSRCIQYAILMSTGRRVNFSAAACARGDGGVDFAPSKRGVAP